MLLMRYEQGTAGEGLEIGHRDDSKRRLLRLNKELAITARVNSFCTWGRMSFASNPIARTTITKDKKNMNHDIDDFHDGNPQCRALQRCWGLPSVISMNNGSPKNACMSWPPTYLAVASL